MSDLLQEPQAPDPAPAASPSAEPAAPAAAPAEAGPKSMLEAMERSFRRDEQGRFAKSDGEPAATPPAGPQAAAVPAPGAVAPAPSAPVAPAAKPEQPEDITAMPEGLGQKAQERFRALANGIKERDQQLTQAREQLTYVQEQFQAHGVRQEQFEQATQVIGMLNRGDLRGALKVLDDQRREIALALGESVPGVDALSEFPDLRDKVNNLQMTEADAMHVAMLRRQQAQTQRLVQTAQQTQAQQMAEQRAHEAGQIAVDQWAKQTSATDLDFPAIEKLLLPKLPQLLAGVPPQQWAAVVRANYELIKESGAVFRRPAAPAVPDALRPAGSGAGKAAPRSMFEAMFGHAASA